VKKIIIFLGAPGSGKGTQAKNIADKYGYHHLSTGELLRAFEKKSKLTAEEKRNLEKVKKGLLVPDAFIYELAFAALKSIFKSGKSVVLDGAIRNLAQAKKFEKFFESEKKADAVIVIEVAITDEEAFKRMIGRKRVDDEPEIMKQRIKVQGNNSIAPIREYYRSLGVLRKVDGMGSIDEVFELIQKELQ